MCRGREVFGSPDKSGEAAAWNEEEFDGSDNYLILLASRGALGDGALPICALRFQFS